MPVTQTGLETREFKLRALRVDAEGIFEGYASTFGNVDSYGDVIAAGAFRKTLSDQPDRPLLWCHDPREPIGKVTLTEDSRGLRVSGALLLSLAKAREVYDMMKAGIARGLSIGFYARRTRAGSDGGRVIEEAELVEVSATPFPANPLARIEAVRSKPAVAAEKSKENEIMEVRDLVAPIEQKVNEIAAKFTEMQRQVDIIDGRMQSAAFSPRGGGAGFADQFVATFTERKSTFEAGGRLRFTLPHPLLERREIVRPANLPAIAEPRIGAAAGEPVGALLDMIPRLSISGPAAYVLREDASAGWVASPQVETQPKYESDATFDGTLVPVRTLATWVAVSRQALDDIEALGDFIRARLEWALARKLEEQILSGSGSGENLYGLMPQAQVWTPPSGGNWDLYGQLAYAATQVELAGFRPTAVIVHPNDYRRITLQRDENRQYVQPPAGVPPLVASAAMGAGTFLVADFSQTVLRVRQDVTIDIATEHSDFFAKNKVAIRAEQRCALVVYSPAAFVKGALAASPA
jgi:HK97 family phage prohead protease